MITDLDDYTPVRSDLLVLWSVSCRAVGCRAFVLLLWVGGRIRFTMSFVPSVHCGLGRSIGFAFGRPVARVRGRQFVCYVGASIGPSLLGRSPVGRSFAQLLLCE